MKRAEPLFYSPNADVLATLAAMIAAVVLAAGSSTRMGGVPKLLLPFGGEPLLARTVRQVAESGFDEVLVVVGHEHEQVQRALDGLPVRVVVNQAFASGMGSSFRAAVEAFDPQTDAAMFALGDQPFVTTDAYRLMLDTFRRIAPAIVCARYGGVTAPPHIFARELFPELAALHHGARDLLARHRDRTHLLQLSPDLLMDVDTPDDYERAKARLSAGR